MQINWANIEKYLSEVPSSIICSSFKFESNLNFHLIYFDTKFESIVDENLMKSSNTCLYISTDLWARSAFVKMNLSTSSWLLFISPFISLFLFALIFTSFNTQFCLVVVASQNLCCYIYTFNCSRSWLRRIPYKLSRFRCWLSCFRYWRYNLNVFQTSDRPFCNNLPTW